MRSAFSPSRLRGQAAASQLPRREWNHLQRAPRVTGTKDGETHASDPSLSHQEEGASVSMAVCMALLAALSG